MSSRRSASIQESVKEVVHLYLKRRNFFTEGEESDTQPLQELAADTLAEATSSSPNVLAHTAAHMEPAAAETQFARFRSCVLEAPEPYQAVLQRLLYPVFVSLHLELVLGGHSPARFYARHHGPLLSDPERHSLVAELAGISTPDHLPRAALQRYRSSLPEVALSAECSEYLQRALRSPQLALVLQTVSQQVRLAADPEPGRPRRADAGPERQCPAASEDGDPAGELARAAGRLRAEPPPPPTVCAFRVCRPLACAALAPRQHMLATGDERGAAVWPLAAEGLSLAENPAARLPLGLNGGCRPLPEPAPGAPWRPLRAHAGPVFDMAFEPGGAALVTAGEDTTLRAWNTDTWDNVCIYRGHTYPVWSVACQRTARTASQYFVSGSMDRTARLWSYDRTYQLRVFAGHTQDVDCVAIHPNGNYVSSASADGTVRLWSLSDAAQVRVLSGHSGVIHSLQFSPDGRQLGAAGEDRRVRVYELGQGGLLHQLSAHSAAVSCLLWTPDGRSLLSADRYGTINSWNIAKLASDALPARTFVCADSSAVRLQYTPHNYLVAVYGERDS